MAPKNHPESVARGAACVVGIDFGTDSVRSIVADASTGGVLGTSVKYYPRRAKGLDCDPVENRFRQHPLDYLESDALRRAGPTVPARFRGIAVDTTGSTPVLADRSDKPLVLAAPFAENPNAMFVLWKDHTAAAAGRCRNVEEAQQAMSSGTESGYRPDPNRGKRYDLLYRDHLALGSFSGERASAQVMSYEESFGRLCCEGDWA